MSAMCQKRKCGLSSAHKTNRFKQVMMIRAVGLILDFFCSWLGTSWRPINALASSAEAGG
jgi:hypothetical protein